MLSGIVEQVGEETSLFKVGDEVMFAGDFFFFPAQEPLPNTYW